MKKVLLRLFLFVLVAVPTASLILAAPNAVKKPAPAARTKSVTTTVPVTPAAPPAPQPQRSSQLDTEDTGASSPAVPMYTTTIAGAVAGYLAYVFQRVATPLVDVLVQLISLLLVRVKLKLKETEKDWLRTQLTGLLKAAEEKHLAGAFNAAGDIAAAKFKWVAAQAKELFELSDAQIDAFLHEYIFDAPGMGASAHR